MSAGRGLSVSAAILAAFFVCFSFSMSGCEKREKQDIKKVDLNAVEKTTAAPQEEKTIPIGISAMISPKESFHYYVDLTNYIGEKLGMPTRLVQRKTYREMNDLIEIGKVDVAFVCSGPYVDGQKKFGLELLVVPQVHGEVVYYSYIIVHKDSPMERLEDLEGKAFAFTDPNSNTGRMVPVYMLEKIGKSPETFFKKSIYTYSHDNSVNAVADKIVDGAAIDSLIYDYMREKHLGGVADTKVIVKSSAYGIPPVAVNPAVSPEFKEKIRAILLHMHEDEKGKEILRGILIERFVAADDANYETVRQMQDWLQDKAQKK
ncbi:MAG: phosphate/phosphite/phosphonate ABC transporter substrate-binding protein [Candidatus Omnitrophica bacterium]|nr:phosphate/phosphite/phosphonate ABC transporter substrate-binding protein [Candidatus Omnitrophota bacterium]